ncbi:hypothetical protein D047_2367B, partial [Vibrio parahaemolyticus VPTS-2010_2]
TETC